MAAPAFKQSIGHEAGHDGHQVRRSGSGDIGTTCWRATWPVPEAGQRDALPQANAQHDPLQLAGAHVDDLTPE